MVDSLKDLKKLIALCRAQGVETVKFNGIELTLGPMPVKALRDVPAMPYIAPDVTYAPGGITADTRIDTEELTEEQLLFYSATGQDNHMGQN